MSYDLEHPDERDPNATPTARLMPDGIYCCRCTRPLAGIPLNENCPTCATPVAESLIDNPVDASVLNPEADPDETPRCVGCGYDLRGSDENANCPECGIPASRSIHGNFLVYASSTWLAQLDFGSKLIVVGLFGWYILAMVAWACDWMTLANIVSGYAMRSIAEILRMFMFFSIGMHLYGWWIFATREPSEIGGASFINARRALRILVGATIIIVLIQTVLITMRAMGSSGFALTRIDDVAAVFLLFYIATYSVACFWIAQLCARLPDQENESLARSMRWAGPIIMIVLSCAMSIGLILAGIIMLKLLLRFRSKLTLLRNQQPERILDAAISAHVNTARIRQSGHGVDGANEG